MSFRKENYNYYGFAFYNLENLFDTKNDPKTLDDDFTASSQLNWTEKRFRKKIKENGECYRADRSG